MEEDRQTAKESTQHPQILKPQANFRDEVEVGKREESKSEQDQGEDDG